MTQFRIVEHPDRSPTRCCICHGHEGPMVDLNLADFEVSLGGQIASAVGAVFICIRNENNPGCLPQMARLAGIVGVSAAEHSHLRAQLARQIATNHELENDLRIAQEQARLTVERVYQEIELGPMPPLVGVAGDDNGVEPQPRSFRLRRSRE